MHKNRRGGGGGGQGDGGFHRDRRKQVDGGGPSRAPMAFNSINFDMRTIMKDIEQLSTCFLFHIRSFLVLKANCTFLFVQCFMLCMCLSIELQVYYIKDYLLICTSMSVRFCYCLTQMVVQ